MCSRSLYAHNVNALCNSLVYIVYVYALCITNVFSVCTYTMHKLLLLFLGFYISLADAVYKLVKAPVGLYPCEFL